MVELQQQNNNLSIPLLLCCEKFLKKVTKVVANKFRTHKFLITISHNGNACFLAQSPDRKCTYIYSCCLLFFCIVINNSSNDGIDSVRSVYIELA